MMIVTSTHGQNLRHNNYLNFSAGFVVGSGTNMITKSTVHSIILPTVVGYSKVYYDSKKFHDGNPKDMLSHVVGGVVGTLTIHYLRKKLKRK